MIRSTPPAPSTHGTPTKIPSAPYSPWQSAAHGRMRFLSRTISLDHLQDGRRRRVVGTGSHQLDDLAPAGLGAFHQFVQPLGTHQFGHRDAADVGEARQRHHVVAVAAEQQRVDVLHTVAGLLGDEGLEARHVQAAGLADDALGRKAARLPGGVDHGVERVGHDDQDAVGHARADLARDAGDDAGINLDQVVAAHAGPARQPGGQHDDVRAGQLRVVVGAGHAAVQPLDGRGLVQVERLAPRLVGHLRDVEEHDVAQLLGDQPMGTGGADVAGADHGDLRTFEHASLIPRPGARLSAVASGSGSTMARTHHPSATGCPSASAMQRRRRRSLTFVPHRSRQSERRPGGPAHRRSTEISYVYRGSTASVSWFTKMTAVPGLQAAICSA